MEFPDLASSHARPRDVADARFGFCPRGLPLVGLFLCGSDSGAADVDKTKGAGENPRPHYL
jgi:hypothetical protein